MDTLVFRSAGCVWFFTRMPIESLDLVPSGQSAVNRSGPGCPDHRDGFRVDVFGAARSHGPLPIFDKCSAVEKGITCARIPKPQAIAVEEQFNLAAEPVTVLGDVNIHAVRKGFIAFVIFGIPV